MNLNKHLHFFNPTELRNKEIHIIGCGALGSYLALQIAKLGIQRLHLWDFDVVDEHNITNQLYSAKDINKPKTEALAEHLKNQNCDINLIIHGKYELQPLSGIIFTTVDSVELRHDIAEFNVFNKNIELIIDGRIGLTEGQVYAAKWNNETSKNDFIKSTEFKDSEAATPVSPCGTTLSVSPSVLVTVSYMLAILIKYCKNEEIPFSVVFDAFDFKTIKFN